MPRRAAILALAGSLIYGAAWAQGFPSKPIHLIVPNSAGSLQDSVARTVGPELSRLLGQPVIIENKPGAGGRIGLEYVAKQAPADGHTLLSGTISTLASLPTTVKELRFDPLKDLPPLIGVGEVRFALGSSTQYPWKNFRELITEAQARPGQLNYGSSAPSIRLPMEALLRGSKASMVHVPYPGTSQYFQALVSGQVQAGLVNEAQAVAYGDRFRVFAVTGEQRSSNFPNAPTMTELGFPEIGGLSYTLNIAAGTPKPVADKLYEVAAKALQAPEVKEKLAAMKLVPIRDNSQQANARRLADEGRMLADISRAIGIMPE